jgi:hypothetical protein
LDTDHFVDRDSLHTLLGGGGAARYRADIGALVSKSGSGLHQPVAVAVRLEIGLFFKSARPSRARCS